MSKSDKPAMILVVDDEADICRALEFLLTRDGYVVRTAGSGEDAVAAIEREEFDMVLSDLKMGGMSGIQLLEKVKERSPSTVFILMTAFASVENAVEVMRKGANDYIVKPFINDDVRMTIRRHLEFRSIEFENSVLLRQVSQCVDQNRFVGASVPIKRLFEVLEKVIPTRSNIFLLGESGTGKGVVAEIVHYNSPRKKKPFLSINCSAIPETLLESELFGYRKGAFTGANTDKLGLIESADGGTLFLDEIGDMPPQVQTKLLKVIEQGEVMPLGGLKTKTIDVRYIAATNKAVEEEIAAGKFREDLYYRLNVIELTMPPLRERKDDIQLLVKRFIETAVATHGARARGMDEDAMSAITAYDWPGNVRELRNVIERAVVLSSGDQITLADLPDKISLGKAAASAHGSLKEALETHERRIILKTLSDNKWNKESAAREMGIDLATLYRKLKKLNIEAHPEK